ncbi:hypothetical protein BGX28_002391 [Mortierella sp. GBA30]|nr:hypothetical protein BGX28_002391 [Mortierella sp. GBA30]
MPHSACTQQFRTKLPSGGKKVLNIPTIFEDGRHHVRWKDITLIVKNARYIQHGNTLIPFMTDENNSEIMPLRIKHRPGTVLDVIFDDPLPATNSLASDPIKPPSTSVSSSASASSSSQEADKYFPSMVQPNISSNPQVFRDHDIPSLLRPPMIHTTTGQQEATATNPSVPDGPSAGSRSDDRNFQFKPDIEETPMPLIQLRTFIEHNGGDFDEHRRKIDIKIRSQSSANIFYNNMIQVGDIQELVIKLEWNVSRAGIKELVKAVNRARIRELTIDGGEFTSETPTEYLPYFSYGIFDDTKFRFTELAWLIFRSRLRSLNLRNFRQVSCFDDIDMSVVNYDRHAYSGLEVLSIDSGLVYKKNILEGVLDFSLRELELTSQEMDSFQMFTRVDDNVPPTLQPLRLLLTLAIAVIVWNGRLGGDTSDPERLRKENGKWQGGEKDKQGLLYVFMYFYALIFVSVENDNLSEFNIECPAACTDRSTRELFD